MQQRFDPDRLEVSGDATPVVEDVFYNPGVGLADFTVSNSGILAFRSSSRRGYQFAWFDRAGNYRTSYPASTAHQTFIAMDAALRRSNRETYGSSIWCETYRRSRAVRAPRRLRVFQW